MNFVTISRLSIVDWFALGSVDAVLNAAINSSFNFIFAGQKVEPRSLDAVSSQESISDLSDSLTGNVALDAGQLAKRNVTSSRVGEGSRTETDACQRLAGLADLVHGLVSGNLGLVVRGQDAKVDLLVVLIPLGLLPPRSSVAAGAVVGDKKEARDGGDRGSSVDEVDGGVAVDLVCLRS